jgi:hypothetical protein
MKKGFAGIAVLLVLLTPMSSRADAVEERLAGAWTVKFHNGVTEWCNIGKDRTASVLETHRASGGKTEIKNGSLLIAYDDDRLERWTSVGRRAVVEHWFPRASYPHGTPVVGIAEIRQNPAEEDTPRAEPDGRELKSVVTIKTFVATLRRQFSDDTAGELRQFIDPRYLKHHRLEEGRFPIQRLVTGPIYDKALVDPQTVFVIVETNEAEKEVWLFRMAEYKGEMYILPPAPPDPKTRSFKPWSFRRKL